jgi:hypothetical protein
MTHRLPHLGHFQRFPFRVIIGTLQYGHFWAIVFWRSRWMLRLIP